MKDDPYAKILTVCKELRCVALKVGRTTFKLTLIKKEIFED
ncbi:hypothetical protein SAMN06295945_0469 [Polynucleobacter meluiroseus]|uniref:Uncharacterized protein n=1 Tax=Polynucleobacter meluiroseus TaxID=1938814 RepID=A0A240DYV1_9BURK|nr:hypothetical protein SAMN06295945_0469 [Polynucleobacter meluiroseus]